MEAFKGLIEKYSDIRVELYPNEKRQTVYLTGFIVPMKLRNTGIGTKFMEELVTLCDLTGYKILLTPSDSYGGSVRRLKEFYKRFGFVENKGENRDFSHREDMYKEPNETKNIEEEVERIKTLLNNSSQ